MTQPILYDITRLVSRLWNSTPNGIDRVDMTLARRCLKRVGSVGALQIPSVGYRVISQTGALALLDSIDAHFGEAGSGDADPVFAGVARWLTSDANMRPGERDLDLAPRAASVGKALKWHWRNKNCIFARPVPIIPQGARYFNVSQYPVAKPGALDWLASRPDLRPVFFVHDMLPFETPEYFRANEPARHDRRMRAIARHGAGVVVSTQGVKASLLRSLASLGRPNMPTLAWPLPVAASFRQDLALDARLSARPYFIQCGTLEPRKNHLMILQVWREIAARRGRATPKLLIVGARGWENENLVDLLERCPALKDCVLEVPGLSTPALSLLMRNARALLMPSFAEGYGLPLAEAIAMGTPAIASDIAPFHEIAAGRFTPLSPIDGEGWRRTIESMADTPAAAAAQTPQASSSPREDEHSFQAITDFMDAL